eukprot:TRINITY_DN26259_c0_g2_i1.p2 TRINITY_DN26259_c0_g2~~TRINITY_DN26259_c0_g2_i1.p2  ORF type:complete len:134 (-),score=19.37 TRINITY_DN26259_c0_g2_i1:399-800(-)
MYSYMNKSSNKFNMKVNFPSISFEVLSPEQGAIKDPKWIGNTRVFCYYNHNPLFTIGPNWKHFLFLNLVLHGFFSANAVPLLFQASDLLGLISICIVALQLLSYTCTFLINQGIPDLNPTLSQRTGNTPINPR